MDWLKKIEEIPLIYVVLFSLLLVTSSIIIKYLASSAYNYLLNKTFVSDQKIVVLFNFNDEGGFFWGIHNVCNLYWYCDYYRCKPIVYYDDGYYLAETKLWTLV